MRIEAYLVHIIHILLDSWTRMDEECGRMAVMMPPIQLQYEAGNEGGREGGRERAAAAAVYIILLPHSRLTQND
jgi:hypothetical protein